MSVAESGSASSLALLRRGAGRIGPGGWLPLVFLAAGAPSVEICCKAQG
jgi:hypothetical protein